MSYRDLSFPHDAVGTLSILFVLLGLVVTFLVAEQPQGLRALQLNLKLLRGRQKNPKEVVLLYIEAEKCPRIDFNDKNRGRYNNDKIFLHSKKNEHPLSTSIHTSKHS